METTMKEGAIERFLEGNQVKAEWRQDVANKMHSAIDALCNEQPFESRLADASSWIDMLEPQSFQGDSLMSRVDCIFQWTIHNRIGDPPVAPDLADYEYDEDYLTANDNYQQTAGFVRLPDYDEMQQLVIAMLEVYVMACQDMDIISETAH